MKNASVLFSIFHKLGDALVFPGGGGVSVMVSQGLVKKISTQMPVLLLLQYFLFYCYQDHLILV